MFRSTKPRNGNGRSIQKVSMEEKGITVVKRYKKLLNYNLIIIHIHTRARAHARTHRSPLFEVLCISEIYKKNATTTLGTNTNKQQSLIMQEQFIVLSNTMPRQCWFPDTSANLKLLDIITLESGEILWFLILPDEHCVR